MKINKTYLYFILTALFLFSCVNENKSELVIQTLMNNEDDSISDSQKIDSIEIWKYIKYKNESVWSDEFMAEYYKPIWEDKHLNLEGKTISIYGTLLEYGFDSVMFCLKNPFDKGGCIIEIDQNGYEAVKYIEIKLTHELKYPSANILEATIQGEINLNSIDPLHTSYILKNAKVIWQNEIPGPKVIHAPEKP